MTVWAAFLGCAAVVIYRLVLREQMQLGHVDGLLVLCSLLAGAMLYLPSRGRLPQLVPFAMPILAFLLTWGICASWWTWRPFEDGSVVHGLHLASVYLSPVFLAIAAVGGAMYLWTRSHLRAHQSSGQPLAPLETTERLIIRTSAVGFVWLTIAIVTGVLIMINEPDAPTDQATSRSTAMMVKIVLAMIVWLVYAVVMNVKHATRFRGRRAAWLSIIGLLLLIVTMALSTVTGDGG